MVPNRAKRLIYRNKRESGPETDLQVNNARWTNHLFNG